MYRLPPALRPVLATPFGPVHPTEDAVQAARQARLVIAVGDVVTQTLLDHGIVPKLMVVDGVTQRGTKVEAALRGLPAGVREVRARNPPAEITRELHDALAGALQSEGSTVVIVQGEEDLAALPAMILAEDGALVCYGQPPARSSGEGPAAPEGAAGGSPDLARAQRGGVVVVVVTPLVRQKAKDILTQMEVK